MTGRPVALFGRIAATLLTLLFAALAVASGLDRMSLSDPALARLIPPVLRAQSARSAAGLAIVRQQRGLALAHARQAVESDPVHPASTTLLGAAYLLAGDLPKAEAAFRVAARFGWRQPATQLYWYQAALQSGDMPRAADRADALMRTRPGFAGSELVLAGLESTPAGRAALIARLANRPQWLELYLRPDASTPDEILDRRAVVLGELAAAGTRLGCDAVAPFASVALDRGARQQAETVWAGHCPGADLGRGLADGGFEQFGRDAESPFGWRGQPAGDVTVRVIERRPGDRSLELRNQSSVSRMVLRQAVALEPGVYRLTGEVAAGRMAASLGCGEAPPVPAGVEGDIGAGGQVLRVAPCSRLELGLWLRPGGGEAELDTVELRKIG
jgi:hypothetical protein